MSEVPLCGHQMPTGGGGFKGISRIIHMRIIHSPYGRHCHKDKGG